MNALTNDITHDIHYIPTMRDQVLSMIKLNYNVYLAVFGLKYMIEYNHDSTDDDDHLRLYLYNERTMNPNEGHALHCSRNISLNQIEEWINEVLLTEMFKVYEKNTNDSIIRYMEEYIKHYKNDTMVD